MIYSLILGGDLIAYGRDDGKRRVIYNHTRDRTIRTIMFYSSFAGWTPIGYNEEVSDMLDRINLLLEDGI